MKRHVKDRRFNPHFDQLPAEVQAVAIRAFANLRDNPRYPGLHFKKVRNDLWSVRIGLGYRALATEGDDNFQWFWIGTHTDYDQILRNL